MPGAILAGDDIEDLLYGLVSEKLRELFETKHLYQSVTIDLSPIEQRIKEAKGSPFPADVHGGGETQEEADRRLQTPLRQHLEQMITSPWKFDTESTPLQKRPAKSRDEKLPLRFRIPTICVACNFCDGVRPPHNSGFLGENALVYGVVVGNDKGKICQVFTFPFQCQKCKGEPIFYLIHREGLKFTIAGRSRFPEVDTPKSLPDPEKRYFRNAIIGHTAGQTLAALFLLRVFIEQYMRRVTNTGKEERLSGEELAARYSALLADDFPPKFDSFKRVYLELSQCLHAADASEEQFEKSRKDIEDHFNQLQLLPLK